MNKPNRIFISYRRDGGDGLAGRVRDALRQRGYKVFLDVEDLKTGKFNEALLAEIDRCTDFVLILSTDSLDRCVNEGDWVRLEIAYALKREKNILPVIGRNFHFPANLPADIAEVRLYNGIKASHDLFEASMDKLSGLLQSQPRNTARAWLATVTGIILLGSIFLGWQFWPKPDAGVAATASTPSNPVSPSNKSDSEQDSRPSPSFAGRSFGAADADQLSADLAQLILAALGQKRLLYNSQGPIQFVLDRVLNETMQMLDTELVVKKLRADLTASGSIEFSNSNPMLDELQAINAFKNGVKPPNNASAPTPRYVLSIKISQWNEPNSSTFTMMGTLAEVVTGAEVWQGSVELKKP